MDFEQVQFVVDVFDQTDAASQKVHRTDTAVGDAAIAFAEVVMNVGRGENWLGTIPDLRLLKAKLNSTLAAIHFPS